MSAPTITLTVKLVDGEQGLNSETLVLLFGVDAELIEAHSAMMARRNFQPSGSSGASAEPKRPWRTTGLTMLDSLRYWAHKDHGAELRVVYE